MLTIASPGTTSCLSAHHNLYVALLLLYIHLVGIERTTMTSCFIWILVPTNMRSVLAVCVCKGNYRSIPLARLKAVDSVLYTHK